MKLGCHVSIRNGYLGAAKRAFQFGANAYQYFPKNPRSLTVKTIDSHDTQACAEFCKENGIVSIAHTPYPTNIAATGDKVKLVVDSLKNDLEIAEACGSLGIVVHFGSTSGDPIEGYKQMIAILDEVLESWEGGTKLLIENNAGKGDQLGTTIEELIKIRELTSFPEKIGFCFDTCHGFAADLWNGQNWSEVLSKNGDSKFIEMIKAIHFNNSVYPNGSRKDRHAPIADGLIPWEGMTEILTTAAFSEVPFILETPGKGEWPHQKEIELMKQTIGFMS